MRIRDNFFNDGVAAIGIGVRATVSKRMIGQAFDFVFEVTFPVMEETLTIADQVLKVPELRPIYCRIVDFGDDAIPKRKPDLAGSCVCGSHPVFPSVSPSRMNPRPSERNILIV
jgi:hypothetical protein